MKPSEVQKWATENGWQHDNYGHMQKTVGEHKYRLKFGKRTLKYEVRINKTEYSAASWMRRFSGYYGQLSVSEKGKLKGMKR